MYLVVVHKDRRVSFPVVGLGWHTNRNSKSLNLAETFRTHARQTSVEPFSYARTGSKLLLYTLLYF